MQTYFQLSIQQKKTWLFNKTFWKKSIPIANVRSCNKGTEIQLIAMNCELSLKQQLIQNEQGCKKRTGIQSDDKTSQALKHTFQNTSHTHARQCSQNSNRGHSCNRHHVLGIISTISVNIQGIRINSDEDENTSWAQMRIQYVGIHSCCEV